MKIDSIIFDLDGTLWDSSAGMLRAWNVVINNNKISEPITLETLQGVLGMQAHQIGSKLFPYLEKAQQLKTMDLCCEETNKVLRREGGTLYLDLENILQTLSQSYSLFIVSNCQSGYIEAFLAYHKLEKYFKDIECSGNTGLIKGENVKKIMEKHKLKSPVYVGDAQVDCDAAKLAKIPFVFASYGFGKVDSYDFIIRELGDLLEPLSGN